MRRPDVILRWWGGSAVWVSAAWETDHPRRASGALGRAAAPRPAPPPRKGDPMNNPPICLTSEDAERLRQLIAAPPRDANGADRAALALLKRELERATLVAPAAVPPDVATMNSTVRVLDLGTGERMTFTIAWPEEADAERARVNVLAPLGMALLGCRKGQDIAWQTPGGQRCLRVEAVLDQPEAARHPAPG